MNINVRSYDFGTENLTVILNYLTNNIDKFVLDAESFKKYNDTVKILKPRWLVQNAEIVVARMNEKMKQNMLLFNVTSVLIVCR